jgi:hypothetical protein
MKTSSFLSLNVQDFVRGLIMAVGGAVFAVIQSSISAGVFTIDWVNIWHIALAAFVVYIGKNFFTPAPATVEIDPAKTQVINTNTKIALTPPPTK